MTDNPQLQPVVVKDVKMPFWSMVVFMVKWAIASIPAVLILVVLLWAAYAFVGSFLGTLSRRARLPSPYTSNTPAAATSGSPEAKTIPVETFVDVVRLQNARMEAFAGRPGFSGELKNIGSRTIRLVEVSAIDRRSKSVAPVVFTPVQSATFAPGTVLAFGYPLEDKSSDWRTAYEIKITRVDVE